MIDLREVLPFGLRILTAFGPREYGASSIKDFYDHKDQLQVGRGLRLRGFARITFPNVNYAFNQETGEHSLVDLTGELPVIVTEEHAGHLFNGEYGGHDLPEGRLEAASILYKPSTREVFLDHAEEIGPPTEERVKPDSEDLRGLEAAVA